MMQTLLTNSSAAPTAADKSAVLTTSQDGGEGALQSGGKVGFSEVMNRVQQADKVNAKADGKAPARPGAEQGNVGAAESNKPVPTAKGEAAKSLANEAEEAAGADDKPQKGSEPDPALAPNDFLQRLQDALKQDTSLVAPPAINLVATAPVVETDGKMLPHKDADAESAEASATLTQPLAGSDKQGATTSAAALARQAASLLTGETSVPVDAKAAQPDAVMTDDAALAAQLQETGKEGSGKESGAGANADQPTENNGKETKGSKSKLSAAERAALLSKVPAALSEQGENDTKIQLEGADKGAKPVVPPMAGKEEPVKTAPLQATHQAVATQPGAARAFEEGVTRTDDGSSSAAADKAPTQTATEGDGQSKAVVTKAEGQPAPAASSGAPAPATASEPVLVAPQQVLASSEPQGPQASLASLSAGLKQMEATERSDAPRARSEVKVDVKQKVAELARGGAQESSETTTTPPESSRSQQVQQNSQPQAVGHDNRPAATEAAARREPANLPHLKLADPEAPAQLHQKVNLMLADKLQQAEIQLDPLGLGKMKIQIQMGADSQANVHFVVQHGQTREMLEQAMPRLRDMLAGQGIQLGQTLVQQQPQQQSQGQSAFAGQGQQGQKGSGSFAETGQTEAEVTGAGMRLSTESTNDSGIDFYA
ncbi:flagellar hook-length control protein FliK [Aeromonas hydrophila]